MAIKLKFPLLVAVLLWRTATAALQDSVTQYGITWYFDQDYEVGQFVNGDWWVVGPVTVETVTPAPVFVESVVVTKLSGTVDTLRDVWMHGSVVNPMAGTGSGYDSRVPGFDSTMLTAFPLQMTADQSLVSSISNLDSLTGNSYEAPILTAAALTVVNAVPDSAAFRPPFCGSVYKPYFSTEELRRDLLPGVAPVDGAADVMSVYERRFQRIWLDHYSGWTGRSLHPYQNMSNYGREICRDVSAGAVLLTFDTYTDRMLVNFIQVGIDLYGMLKSGGGWPADGGHLAGRKWPILFAGLMLDDADMMAVGTEYAGRFQEDIMTFYVTRHPNPASAWSFNGTYWESDGTDEDYDIFVPNPDPSLGPDSADYDSAGYRQHEGWGFTYYGHANANKYQDFEEYVDKHENMPEWQLDKLRSGLDWDAAYRSTGNGDSYGGFILAANMMAGARALWNHEVLFDYEDRYMDIGWQTALVRAAWDTYRHQYGCSWVRDDTSDTYSNGASDCSRCEFNCPGDTSSVASAPVATPETRTTVWPNPSNNTVVFNGVTDGTVQIFDTSGRTVFIHSNRIVGTGRDPSPNTRVEWNGTGVNNRTVPPGLYFYTITDETGIRTGTIIRTE